MKNENVEIRYKFLNGSESEHGDMKWRLNKWYKITGKLVICRNGFHCSRHVQDALMYVNGDTLAMVEVRGKSIVESEKECRSEMRVVKRFKFKKEHSVKVAIFSARLCLSAYEDAYPDDNRVRLAIEAAETYVKNPTKKNREAARSAAESAESAAWSAESAARSAARSARSAAWSAARSAESAARSAESAAMSAAWSARSAAMSAAWSAESAAWSAESAAKQQIHDYILSLFEG